MRSIPVSAPEPAPLLAVEGLKVHFNPRDGVVRQAQPPPPVTRPKAPLLVPPSLSVAPLPVLPPLVFPPRLTLWSPAVGSPVPSPDGIIPGNGHLPPDAVARLFAALFDPEEFLSPYGLRALSRRHLAQPYVLSVEGITARVDYEPAESTTGMFGGNSNWRGPIWFPMNFLLIQAISTFARYYGSGFTIECPTGSGQSLTLAQIADELAARLVRIFLRSAEDDRRPVLGDNELFQHDPHWRDYVPFHEYFHGDNGQGVGASHQTGWTGVVAKLLEQTATQPHAPAAHTESSSRAAAD